MIDLIPYVKLGDQWTVNNITIQAVFDTIREEGTLETVFLGRITTAAAFLDYLQDSRNLPVFISLDGRIVGFAWINGIQDNHANAHFCLFRETWGKYTLQIGQKVVAYWFSIPGFQGPLFDVLIGMIPVTNARAIEFIHRLGWKKAGEIPLMFKNSDGLRIAAALSYKVRESVCH